jgi:mono/diheme cytochrome c family protein
VGGWIRTLGQWAILGALSLGGLQAAAGNWVAPESEAKRENPMKADAATIEQGKKLFIDRCVECHGKKGKGDGSGAADLDIRPTDFTQKTFQEQSDGTLFWKTTTGKKPMPGYGKKLTEEQRWQLVLYLRRFARN